MFHLSNKYPLNALHWTMPCVIALTILPFTAFGQDTPIRFSGNLQLGSELYSSTGIAERRPKNASRAIIRPTITLFDQVVLPFEIYVTSEDRGFRQPFNQFGASPRFFGWLTLHGGYFSSQVSELTFGDTRMLGGGIDATPGNFRLVALYGRIQQAVNPDTANGFSGAYERTAFAGKIGYGSTEAFFIDVNFMRAVDDSSSIQSAPVNFTPAENVVASIDLGFPLFDGKLHFKTEFGVSAFSSDIRSREVSDGSAALPSLFTSRTSSQVDGAVTASLHFTASTAFSLGLETRWIGPGYVSLGYAQLPNDVLDVTLSPTIRLADNRVHVRSTFGLRFNNLRENRLSTTKRTIFNLSGAYQATDMFGVDIQYSNYGMRSTPRNDTLRVDNISQSLTLSPRLSFDSFGGTSFVGVSYSLQDFTDKNTITSATSENTSHAVSTTWSLTLPSSLSFTTNYTFIQSMTSLLTMKIHTITETIGYAFFDNALSLSITGGYNILRGMSSDGQATGTFTASYNAGDAGTFTLIIMTNTYNYENSLSGTSFSESQGSLMYSYAF